jgi:superoxide reductase
MNRRNFIYLGAAGSTLSLITPQLLIAADAPKLVGAGGLFYTKDAPGHWKGKEAGHLPQMAIEKVDGKLKVTVTTEHVMKFHEHYIVKHQLLDQDLQFVAEKMFTDPEKDQDPTSTHELADYKGEVIYALSVCNKHDAWLSMMKIG